MTPTKMSREELENALAGDCSCARCMVDGTPCKHCKPFFDRILAHHDAMEAAYVSMRTLKDQFAERLAECRAQLVAVSEAKAIVMQQRDEAVRLLGDLVHAVRWPEFGDAKKAAADFLALLDAVKREEG